MMMMMTTGATKGVSTTLPCGRYDPLEAKEPEFDPEIQLAP